MSALEEAAVWYATVLGVESTDSEIEAAQARVLEAALAHGRAVTRETCRAAHPQRPDAACSLPATHGGYHSWTRSHGCAHLRFHRNPPECTACGVIRYPATPAPSEARGPK